MINRAEAPTYKQPEKLNILAAKEFKLQNGIPVQYIEGGTQEVCKIDLIFPAGVVQSHKPLLASFTSNLMLEGTENMTSFEIAEKVDYYGAFLAQSTNYHHSQVTLYTLTKHLDKLLPVLEEVVKRPVFSQHEFDIYLAKKKQDFLVDSEKVKTLAHRKSQEILFTNAHPYGRVAKVHHFDEIGVEDLKDFYKKQYASNLCEVIVSGRGGDKLESFLNQYFGGDDWSVAAPKEPKLPEVKGEARRFFLVEKADAKQSAIKIVRNSVTKDHEDYLPLQVLNTVFGGYFGSRLMTNLREEKGLTYGISSYTISFIEAGIFGVSTEVVAEKRDLAVSEIFAEMGKMQNNLVSDEELSRVKNYMLGELQRNLDGPFAVSDAYRGLMGFKSDISFYHKFTELVKNITAEEIQTLAQKYLNPQDFYTVIAGK